MLILPSKKLLQYYKISVKQSVGIRVDTLPFMAMNCCRPSIPYFGKHDGLLIYKIVIEYDLIIEKVGDVWNLVGLVDIGEKQHFSYMQKDKKVGLAIHAFQFVSQCFTGFRRVSALQPVIFYHIKKILLIENDICDLSRRLI